MASVASRVLATALLLGCTLLYCDAEDIVCPSGWLGPYKHTCYALSDTKATWTQANTEGCANLAEGAYLASVTYGNKAFLSKQLDIIDTDYYWVGLRSGDAEWNKGTRNAEYVDFTNWETVRYQEPNGNTIRNDVCVLAVGEAADPSLGPAGNWMDWSCEDYAYPLCQLKQKSCPESWTEVNGVCYQLAEEWLTYSQAESHCAGLAKGATLATAHDYAELSQSVSMANTAWYWIGLRSTPNRRGKLVWADGRPVTKTSWALIDYEEPFSTGKADDDCVYINGLRAAELYEADKWGNYDCSFQTHFLCAVRV